MSSGVERVHELLDGIALANDASTEVNSIKEYLKLVRELKLRQSETVATYGAALLNNHKGGIPQHEYWTIMEQVAEAALDVHSLDFACSVVYKIRGKFPNSQRAQRLTEGVVQAMYLEAKGKTKEAEDIISKLLEDHPDSLLALRRQVAIEKTKGNLYKATDLLRKHVDTFMTDKDAWEELAELYLQCCAHESCCRHAVHTAEAFGAVVKRPGSRSGTLRYLWPKAAERLASQAQLYAQAAYCYEELLLHSPQSVPLHVQYADVLYTMGGGNVRTARRHYAAAVKLSGGENLRALYGICCTAAALVGQKGKTITEDDVELTGQAAELLVRLYKEENQAQLPLARDLLKAQGLKA